MLINKIAILCNYQLLPDRVGGMDYFFWLFDQKCKASNINIDWFFPNKSLHGEYKNLTIHEADGQSVENYFLSFCQKHNTQYSHVVTHFVELCAPFFYKLKQMSAAKVIAVDHNPRPINGYPLKKRIEKKLKGILFSRYIDLFVGVSQSTANEIAKDFGKKLKRKIIVIPNGLDVNKFAKKLDFATHNKFIVACHLRKEKGVQDLIRAVKDLKEYNFKIDIYGEGYFESELKFMVQNFNLQDKIKFKGGVSNLNEIYCKYDYLLHPSHGETFCYTVLESLFSDLPVITTRNQGNVLGLVVENVNGFLFEEQDTNGLRTIIENVLREEKRIMNYFKSTDLERFTLDEMVKNYLDLVFSNKL